MIKSVHKPIAKTALTRLFLIKCADSRACRLVFGGKRIECCKVTHSTLQSLKNGHILYIGTGKFIGSVREGVVLGLCTWQASALY